MNVEEVPTSTRRLPVPPDYHLRHTMGLLQMGRFDPSFELTDNELRTSFPGPKGPVGLVAEYEGETIHCRLWGDQQQWLYERLPTLFGLHDRPWEFSPAHPVLRRLSKRFRGMHLPRLPAVFTCLVQALLQQLVSWNEALGNYRRMVQGLGSPVPGLVDLKAPPSAARLRETHPDQLIAYGVLPRQARTISRVSHKAESIEAAATRGPGELSRLLTSFPGIGPWTESYVLGSALGEPDAVLLGDYKLPSSIAFLMEKEARASEARMLELLEPFSGHRFRVIRWSFMSGITAPRRGPRHEYRPRDY